MKIVLLAVSLLVCQSVLAVLPTPTPTAPANGANGQDANELIDWGPSSGQTYYELRYGTDPALQSTFTTEVPTLSSFTTSNLLWGQTYYWKVRAMSPTDSSAWTPIYSFTILNQLTHVAPGNGATDQAINVTIDWTAIGGLIAYDYQVDVTPAFNSPQLIQSSTGTSSQALSGLGFSTLYYWRVRVRHATDTSLWSAPWSFTTVDGVPQLLAPGNGVTNQNVQVDLDWQAVAGQISYDYQADVSTSFNTGNLISGTTVSTSLVTINTLLYNSLYYWRIRTRTSVDTSAWSTIWSFSTLGSVTLLQPASGSTNQDANETIDWTAISGTGSYDYQLDTSSLFNSAWLINGSSGATSLATLSNLHYGETYFWRVRSRNNADTSAWSAPWIFTVRATVGLIAPGNAATAQQVNVTLDSDAIGGSNNFQFQTDTVPGFNSGALFNFTTVSSLTNTSQLLFGKQYFWRARAMHAQDTSDWSAVWTFTTLNEVALVSPGAGATGVTVNPILDWTGVNGITGYNVIWDDDPTLSAPNLLTTGTTSQQSLSGLAFGETYYWTVRAFHALDQSAYAPVRSFTTAYQLTTSPLLTTPADLSTGIPLSLSLSWQAVSGALTYQYQVSEFASFISPVAFGTTSNLNAAISGLSNNTIYFWRVRANNGAGYSPWSTVWIFTTQSGSLTVAPLLQSPGDGATGIALNPTITWNSVPGANSYEYQVDQTASFASPLSGSGALLSATLSGLAYNTTYYWRVRASNGTANSPWSTVWSFTTLADPISIAPLLISPANLSVNIPLNNTFQWSAVATAITYELQVDGSASFASPISVNGSAVSTAVPGLLNSTQYFWRVRAGNGTQFGPWSSVFSFTTVGVVLSQAPVLLAPADGLTGITVNPTFSWSTLPGASLYELEIDISPSFPSPQLISSANASAVAGPLAFSQQFYWRVRGFNQLGYSPYSNIWTFTTESNSSLTAPVLLSPADLSTNVPLNTLFNWSAVAAATSYELEYDLSPSFASPTTVPAIFSTVGPLNLLAATQYYWRVRAMDGTVPGPWSVILTFETELTTGFPGALNSDVPNLMPNPASDFFQIALQGFSEEALMSVFSSDGKRMLVQQVSEKTLVDCSAWPVGLYQVVLTGEYRTATYRLLIK